MTDTPTSPDSAAVLSLAQDARWRAFAAEWVPRFAATADTDRGVTVRAQVDTIYDALARNAVASRLVIPVIGVQGSGKSTLLNALLFDRPVLPSDVDETTCVPVEVAFGDTISARVLFTDGNSRALEPTEEGLRSVVHNEANPGNVQRADRVQVFTPSPLLRDGIVLVDLPGVGSLTQHNVETTRRYLEQVPCAIYLLRSVPPLTRSDMLLLKLTWPNVMHALFVQNRWHDESDEETNDARQHNLMLLRKAAEDLAITLDPDFGIDVVDAYEAWSARLTGNEAVESESGIVGLRGRLSSVAPEWRRTLAQSARTVLLSDVERGRAQILSRMADLDLGDDALRASIDEAQRNADAHHRHAQETAARYKGSTSESIEAILAFIAEWAATARRRLRSDMRERMQKGAVSTAKLGRALDDLSRTVTVDLYEEVELRVVEVSTRLRPLLGEIEAEFTSDSRLQSSDGPKGDDSRRYEKVAKTGLRAVFGLTGMTLGAEIGGLVGIVGGPAGMAVGALGGLVVGFLGSMLGGFIGGLIEETTLEGRIEGIWPDVERHIEERVSRYAAQLRSDLDRHFDGLAIRLDAWIQAQKREAERVRSERLKLLELDKTQLAALRAGLEGALAEADSFAARLGGTQ